MKFLILLILFSLSLLFSCNESASEKKSVKEKRKELIEIKRYDFKPYKPEQPIKFNHKIHAGENGIACSHCHKDHTEEDTMMLKDWK